MPHIKPLSIDDEINFWGRQLSDHCLFIYLGLVSDALVAGKLKNNLKQDALDLHNAWTQALLAPQQQSIIQLLRKTIQLKEKVLSELDKGPWIGWISYSFVLHILNEARYFLDKVQGIKLTLNDEIKFWLYHHKSELEAEDKLIDPSEKALSKLIQAFVQN